MTARPRLRLIPLVFAAFTLLSPAAASAVDAGAHAWPDTSSVDPFPAPFASGSASVAAFGTDDGIPGYAIGAGPGGPPLVELRSSDGGVLASFEAYGAGMTRGVSVAAGDLDGDGSVEFATAAGPGSNGHVRILDAAGAPVILSSGFFPFGRDNRAGARVATGDLDGDGTDELIVAAGPSRPPRISVWALDGRGFLGEFPPFDEKMTGGISIAAGDLDGDGRDEIIAAQTFGGPEIRTFDGLSFAQERTFDAGLAADGITVAAGDLDGDGRDEIAVAAFAGGEPRVEVRGGDGVLKGGLLGGDTDDRGGVVAAVGRTAGGSPGLLVLPAGNAGLIRPASPQYVTVDISEQRLRAYEFGRPVNSFLISSGTAKFPTPLGEFMALAKPLFVHYRWSYGEGNPDNYDLGLVPWNVRIYPHVYIHYAYWHDNFGRRMSHGCVNASEQDAQWIYQWIEVGTPISVIP